MPPAASTTMAAATFGSRHSTKSSFGHASSSRPSKTLITSADPQLTQKWPTRSRLDGFGFGLGLVGFRSRTSHVRRPDLVPATLLGRVQRLVGAVDELRVDRRLLGRGDSDADGELEAAGERGRGDLGADALGEHACA